MKTPRILVEAYQPVVEAVQNRGVRTTALKVLDNTPKKAGADPSFGVPGVVFVFLARKGSGALDRVVQAVQKGGAAATKLVEGLSKQAARFKTVEVKQAVGLMLEQEVFASLRYGGETIAQGLFLPKDAELTFVPFPYNGGALAKEGFVLQEHLADGSKAGLEALIVKIDPVLSPAEKAALRLVPADQLVRNIGLPLSCGDSYTAVGIMVAAVVVTLLLTCLRPVPLADMISQDELKKLGPAASARRLLALRRQVLMKNMPA